MNDGDIMPIYQSIVTMGFFVFIKAHSATIDGGIAMKNTERTLDSLRNAYEGHIYLSFNSQQEYDDFLTAAESEGYRFGEHLPTEHLGEGWDIIAIEHDHKLAFCGFVSHMAFGSGDPGVHKVDYAKYAAGDDFFVI